MVRFGYGLSALLILFGIGNYSVGNVIISILNFVVAVMLIISSTMLRMTNQLQRDVAAAGRQPPTVRRKTNITIVLNFGRDSSHEEPHTPDPTRDKIIGPD